MLVIPPAAQLLIDRGGWQSAYRWLGLATLAVIPVIFVLPLTRYSSGSAAWRATRSHRAASGAGVWTAGAAMRTGAFWSLFLVYFMTSVAAYSVLPHSVAHMIERGISPLVAAGAFGFTGLLSAIGIIAIGWLSDRKGRRFAATLSYASTILGIACLMGLAWQRSPWLVYGFAIFFGLMQGARGPILVALTGKMFPGGNVGSIYGALSMALGFGAGFGSWASGLLHQATGTYTASFILAIAAAAIGSLAFWVLPSLRQERVIRDPTPT
jgi:MFS family permease